MKKIALGAIAVALLAPVPALAQSAFDGTWKADVSSAQLPKKPDELMLKNGMWDCKTCTPPEHVKADGMDHAVSGSPYYDSEAVKVVSDREVQFTQKKNGKVVGTGTDTVSPDGKTLTFEFSDSSATNAAPVTGKGTETRVGAEPAGAHAVSGSWRTVSISKVSDNGLTFTYKVNGDSITMTNQTGQKYTAKMNGGEAPMTGDPGVTSVSVRKLGPNLIVETDRRGAKVISVATMKVAPDGKSMKVTVHNKQRGTRTTFTANKV